MKKSILSLLILSFTLSVASAQVQRTGNVELIDMSEDFSQLTFTVEGIASRKADVDDSAMQTLFYRLFYEGVEGVNDGEKLIQHDKKYWEEKFFVGKNNAPYHRFIRGIEQEGATVKEGDDFKGTFNIEIKYKALLKEMMLNGVRDGATARAERPKRSVGIAAKEEANQKKIEAEKAEKERERQLKQQEQQLKQQQQQLEQQQKQLEEQQKQLQQQQVVKVPLSKDGVGPVKIGDKVAIPNSINRCKLPDTYPSLYDKLYCDRDQFVGNSEILCELGGQTSLQVFSDDNDKVYYFTVTTPNAVTADGLSLNSTAAEIRAKGAKTDKKSFYDNGVEYRCDCFMLLNGLYFFFSKSDYVGNKIRDDAKPKAISNVQFGGSTDYFFIE